MRSAGRSARVLRPLPRKAFLLENFHLARACPRSLWTAYVFVPCPVCFTLSLFSRMRYCVILHSNLTWYP